MDQDVAAYAQVCRIAADAVSSFVWRVRYARYFDLPEGLNTDQIAKDYKILRSISKKWTCFDETLLRRIIPLPIQVTQEQRFNRPLCLSMLKSLIIGAFSCHIKKIITHRRQVPMLERIRMNMETSQSLV